MTVAGPSTLVATPSLASVARRRVEWVDYAKGIAIALVVAGHVIGGMGESVKSTWLWTWRDWMYTLHMPAFMALAGLFVMRAKPEKFGAFVKDKLRVLMYPCAVWVVLQWLCHLSMSRFTNTRPSLYAPLMFPLFPYMNLWFLTALFVIMTLYAAFVRAGLRPLAILAPGVALFVIHMLGWSSLLTGSPPRANTIDDACAYFLYFAMGAAFAPHLLRAAEKLPTAAVGLFVAAGFGLHGMLFYYAPAWVGEVPTAWSFHGAAVMEWAMAIPGVLGLLAVSVLLERFSIARFLRWWGTESLAIYLVHGLPSVFLRILLQRLFHVESLWLLTALCTGAGIGVALLLSVLCKKFNFPYLFQWPARKVPAAQPMEVRAS